MFCKQEGFIPKIMICYFRLHHQPNTCMRRLIEGSVNKKKYGIQLTSSQICIVQSLQLQMLLIENWRIRMITTAKLERRLLFTFIVITLVLEVFVLLSNGPLIHNDRLLSISLSIFLIRNTQSPLASIVEPNGNCTAEASKNCWENWYYIVLVIRAWIIIIATQWCFDCWAWCIGCRDRWRRWTWTIWANCWTRRECFRRRRYTFTWLTGYLGTLIYWAWVHWGRARCNSVHWRRCCRKKTLGNSRLRKTTDRAKNSQSLCVGVGYCDWGWTRRRRNFYAWKHACRAWNYSWGWWNRTYGINNFRVCCILTTIFTLSTL